MKLILGIVAKEKKYCFVLTSCKKTTYKFNIKSRFLSQIYNLSTYRSLMGPESPMDSWRGILLSQATVQDKFGAV